MRRRHPSPTPTPEAWSINTCNRGTTCSTHSTGEVVLPCSQASCTYEQRKPVARWAWYFICSLSILIGSFWTYLWIYRVEFLETALRRTCAPYAVSIGSIDFIDSTTVVIKNLSIHTKEEQPQQRAHISQAVCSSSTSSWLFWLLTPSHAPLHLTHVHVTVDKGSDLLFDPSSSSCQLKVDALAIDQTNGSSTTLQNIHGPIATLLAATVATYMRDSK